MNHHCFIILLCLIQTVFGAPTSSERWGYGILASFGVSMIGFVVSIMIIILKKFSKGETAKQIMKVLIGFAIGALLGDAFIHLIPHSFSNHEHHEEEDHDHELEDGRLLDEEEIVEEEEEDISKEFLTSLLLLLGVLSFFLIEKSMIVLQSYVMNQKVQPEGQNFDVAQQDTNMENKNIGDSPDIIDKVQRIQELHFDKIQQLTISQQLFSFESWKYKPTLGYLNLVSDFLHNIMDGLALGVIFATANDDNFDSTIATLIAIIIHETAQEIGDTSILLENKFTNSQALFSNGLINCSALIGAIIGLGISSMENDTLVLAFVAGNFIYISCVDMLPAVLKEENIKISFLQFIAFCAAVAIMYGIAYYEHSKE
ncbi:unnamed protein product [Paramecium primaurelia]|uniref:Uncharacterized protein n=1 Tax=Paramecium primaurelia TaxID=5886 RepID=A0A8S1KJZ8_PARPR|nr:unnamed protein product [Paramecium primaurelia]